MKAEEIQSVNPRLSVWQAYEVAVKCDLNSSALLSEKGWILLDPIRLAKAALEELLAVAPIGAIVLTNGNHARAAEVYRKQFGIAIYAHEGAVADLGIAVDNRLREGDRIFGGLEVIELSGGGPGEIALWDPAGICCVGDALIHLPPHGFSLLPDKYCSDPPALRQALEKLLRFEFELMTFAHGLPLVRHARLQLASLLV